MPGTIKLVDDAGHELSVGSEEQAALIEKLGYRRQTAGEVVAGEQSSAEHDYYTSPQQEFQAAVEGGARGATLGLLGDTEEARTRAAYNPGTAKISELGGALLPALATGGESLGESALGTAARATPTGLLARGSELAAKALVSEPGLVRGAAQGTIETLGAMSAQRLAQVMNDDPASHESITAGLGVPLLLGAGMGALGGGLESVAGRANSRLSREANALETDTRAAQRTAADDFLARGDVKVRLERVDDALDLARDDVRRAAESADTLSTTAHYAASDAYGTAPAGTSVRDVGREFRSLKSYADDVMGTVGSDPELAAAARSEIAGVRRTFADADGSFRAAKGEGGPTPEEFLPKVDAYRERVAALARKVGREDVPGEFRTTVDPTADEVAAHAEAINGMHAQADAQQARAVDARALQDQLKSVANLSDLRGTDPEQFMRNAAAIESVMASSHVTPSVKVALRGALDDLSERGFGFVKGADLDGLNMPEAARAMGLPDADVRAIKAVDGAPNAREYVAGWTAVRGLGQQAGKVAKVAVEGGSSFVGRIAKLYAGSKAAHEVRGLTGSYALGHAAFHGIAHGALGALHGIKMAVTSRIVKAVGRWGGTAGAVLRRAAPLGLADLELRNVPKTAKQTESDHFREVAAQWRMAGGPDGANALHAALAPLRAVAEPVAHAVALQAQTVAAAIAAMAPKDPGTVYAGLKSRWKPDPIELSSWLSYAKGALDPASVVEDFASGRIRPEGAQALRQLWPATFDQLRGQVVQRLAQVEASLPYEAFVQLSVLLDLPGDGTMTQSFIADQAKMYLEAEQSPGTQAAAMPRSSRSSSSGGITGATKAQQLSA